MREKLIKLLGAFTTPVTLNGEWLCDYSIPTQQIRSKLADYLIASGVISESEMIGQWIPSYTVNWWLSTERIDGYTCNQCARHFKRKSNYCPHCGAKMDGGADNGK